MAEKPYPDFPLYPHKRGHWAKKIRGNTYYFGKVSDGWEAALERYKAERDDLYAGRTPRAYDPNRLTVRQLCNHYLEAAERRSKSGEMRQRTWGDYERTTKIVIEVLGGDTPVDSLRAHDFERLRTQLVEDFALITVSGHVQRVKTILKWAHDSELVAEPIRTGPNFRKPTASLLRREKSKRPARLFSQEDARWLVDNSRLPLRAMILLGLNCGLGNRDCAELEFEHLFLDYGWLSFPRPKTGIDRSAKLWPETVAAIRAAGDIRPKHRSREHAGRVFITKYGGPWQKDDERAGPIGAEFAKLLKAGKMVRSGRGFYALRHTYRTIADECGDQPAVGYTMGHHDPSIAGVYRRTISEERLEKVAEHVRRWLYPTEETGEAEAESS